MVKRIKVYVLGIALVLLTALWMADFELGVFAHEGHKHSHAPASAKKLKNPFTASEENIAAGRALFNQNCASCHGEDGKSKTDIAEAMTVKPTDLTDKKMQGIKDGEIYWVIANGVKKSGMPAFKKETAKERWQMTLYVKHLMGEHPHAEHGKH
jgi:mono/diheme cytochrome c family protein